MNSKTFVMIPDMHRPAVKSPRGQELSAAEHNDTTANVTSPSRPKVYESDSSTDGGGYVTRTDDKYSLASVIEHSADFNGPTEHDLAHSSLEESVMFEETPSENTGTD